MQLYKITMCNYTDINRWTPKNPSSFQWRGEPQCKKLQTPTKKNKQCYGYTTTWISKVLLANVMFGFYGHTFPQQYNSAICHIPYLHGIYGCYTTKLPFYPNPPVSFPKLLTPLYPPPEKTPTAPHTSFPPGAGGSTAAPCLLLANKPADQATLSSHCSSATQLLSPPSGGFTQLPTVTKYSELSHLSHLCSLC